MTLLQGVCENELLIYCRLYILLFMIDTQDYTGIPHEFHLTYHSFNAGYFPEPN